MSEITDRDREMIDNAGNLAEQDFNHADLPSDSEHWESIRLALYMRRAVQAVAAAREESRQEERERPMMPAPGLHEIAEAARILCRELCAAYPCRDGCSPSSRTWDLAVDMLRAAGVLRTLEQRDFAKPPTDGD